MALIPPYELDKRGRHLLAELDGYTLDQKIEFLHYLLQRLEKQKESETK